jgi:hypothetical protein
MAVARTRTKPVAAAARSAPPRRRRRRRRLAVADPEGAPEAQAAAAAASVAAAPAAAGAAHTVGKRDDDSAMIGKGGGGAAGAAAGAHPVGGVGGGQALPRAERGLLEPRFGRDLGGVRLHHDGSSNALAEALGARAFTVGEDIVFARGQFRPGTREGRALMAHELSHMHHTDGGALVQRDLATPEPAKAPAAQPDLTKAQIQTALSFDASRFDSKGTKFIQDLIGTEQTGTFSEGDVLAVAAIQEKFGLKKDGTVGKDTLRFLDKEAKLEGVPATDAECPVSFFVMSENEQAPTVTGGLLKMKGPFNVHAQFPERCNCQDYEYRQFIRGTAVQLRGGALLEDLALASNIPGGLTTTFTEDGDTTDTTTPHYGHRAEAPESKPVNHYIDFAGSVDQARGCRFESHDAPGVPGIPVLSGDVVDIDIRMRGEIQRKGNMVRSLEWVGFKRRFVVP